MLVQVCYSAVGVASKVVCVILTLILTWGARNGVETQSLYDGELPNLTEDDVCDILFFGSLSSFEVYWGLKGLKCLQSLFNKRSHKGKVDMALKVQKPDSLAATGNTLLCNSLIPLYEPC